MNNTPDPDSESHSETAEDDLADASATQEAVAIEKRSSKEKASKQEFNLQEVWQTCYQMILEPRAGWRRVAELKLSIPELCQRYFYFLVAIPPLGKLIGDSLNGNVTIGESLVLYAAYLAYLGLFTYIVQKVSPELGWKPTKEQGFCLVAFGLIPSWVSGAFLIIPNPLFDYISLALTLYAVYVYYIGVCEFTTIRAEARTKFVAFSLLGPALALTTGMLLTAPLWNLIAPGLVAL